MIDPQSPKPTRRGCLFYAVSLALVLFLMVIIGAGAGYLALRKAVNKWTQTSPVQVEREQVSQAEAAALQRKLQAFRNALSAGKAGAPLNLTDHELNGLIATSPDLQGLDGKLHLAAREGRLEGKVSLPLDETGVSFLKGRYLNGVGTFKPSISNGQLRVMIQDFQVDGQPLPRRWMNMLQKFNLAEKLNQNPEATAVVQKLKDIDVRSNAVEIVPLQE